MESSLHPQKRTKSEQWKNEGGVKDEVAGFVVRGYARVSMARNCEEVVYEVGGLVMFGEER